MDGVRNKRHVSIFSISDFRGVFEKTECGKVALRVVDRECGCRRVVEIGIRERRCMQMLRGVSAIRRSKCLCGNDGGAGSSTTGDWRPSTVAIIGDGTHSENEQKTMSDVR
jgi:hypothetical protein